MPSERKRGPGVPRAPGPLAPGPGAANRGFASNDPERQREDTQDEPPQVGAQPAPDASDAGARRRAGRGGQTGGGGTG